MLEDLISVLYPIVSIVTFIFSVDEQFQKCAIWLWHENIDQFMNCRGIYPFMEHKKVLLFILLHKYITVHKILELVLAQKYFIPHYSDLNFLYKNFKLSPLPWSIFNTIQRHIW